MSKCAGRMEEWRMAGGEGGGGGAGLAASNTHFLSQIFVSQKLCDKT